MKNVTLPSFSARSTCASLLALTTLFVLPACKDGADKPGESGGGSSKGKPAAAKKLEPLELDASGYNANRTQAFGFLSRLPADTEGVIGALNFSDLYRAISTSETIKGALDFFGEGSISEQEIQMGQEAIDTYVGKELFFALCAGSTDKLSHLNTVKDQMGNFAFGMLNAKSVTAGGADPNEMVANLREPLVTALRNENSELSKAIAGFECPPIILGSKMDGGAAQQVAAWLDTMEDQLPPIAIVSPFDIGDSTFTSWKINFQDIITEAEKAEINEFFKDEKATDALVKMLRAKTFELTYGVIDNYLVVTLGSNHDHLKFVSNPEESILAAKRFQFSDAYLNKELIGYAFAHKGLLSLGKQGGGIQGMAEKISSALTTAQDSAEVKELGGWINRLGTQLSGMGKGEAQTYLGVTYMDEGLHGESVGGFTSELADGKSKAYFANMAPADSALVISGATNPAFRKKSIELVETLAAGVEIGVKAYSSESESPEVLNQYKGLKDGFGSHLEKIWGTLSGDFIEGLGSHSGVIVDFNGTMPKKIPNVPNVIVNEGKIPRIVIASDVKDRKKLAASWEAINAELNSAFEKIPDLELQVPDVMTGDSDHLATHYFSFPYFSNNFMPSLSLNDELFFLSTSKQYTESLAAAAKESSDGDIRGLYMRVNYTEVNKLATHWVDLVMNNLDQLFPDPAQAAEFTADEDEARMILKLLTCMKTLTYNRYEDDSSDWRSSWHLHVEENEDDIDIDTEDLGEGLEEFEAENIEEKGEE